MVDLLKDANSTIYTWAIDLFGLGIPLHISARSCRRKGREGRQHRVHATRTREFQTIQALPSCHCNSFLLRANCHLNHRLRVWNDLKHGCSRVPDIPKEDCWINAGRAHCINVQHVKSCDGFQARVRELPRWGRGLCLQIPKFNGSITSTCEIAARVRIRVGRWTSSSRHKS